MLLLKTPGYGNLHLYAACQDWGSFLKTWNSTHTRKKRLNSFLFSCWFIAKFHSPTPNIMGLKGVWQQILCLIDVSNHSYLDFINTHLLFNMKVIWKNNQNLLLFMLLMCFITVVSISFSVNIKLSSSRMRTFCNKDFRDQDWIIKFSPPQWPLTSNVLMYAILCWKFLNSWSIWLAWQYILRVYCK